MSTPCLCYEYNRRYASIASAPSIYNKQLLDIPGCEFANTITRFVNVLDTAGFDTEGTQLSVFNIPQQRLVHFLFMKNPRDHEQYTCAASLAIHVRNVAKHPTAEDACDAIASSYRVPRKSDLSLPLWYAMVSSTHICS